jgi:hypothetical protein
LYSYFLVYFNKFSSWFPFERKYIIFKDDNWDFNASQLGKEETYAWCLIYLYKKQSCAHAMKYNIYEGCSESFETGSIFSVGKDKIKQEFSMYYFNTSSIIV